MNYFSTATKNISDAVSYLSKVDPNDESIHKVVASIQENVNLIKKLAQENVEASAPSADEDVDFIIGQINNLKAAALVPANNYKKIVDICDSLKKVALETRNPENAKIRKNVASAFRRISGIFAEVDTVQDLDKPLEQIEKAVHGLYGDQSKNTTYYFNRRNKGHHGKDEK